MVNNWTEYSLSELGFFKNGANFNKNDYGESYPVVSVKNLFRGRFVTTNDLDALKDGVISKINEYLIEEGDIVFARSSVKRSGAGQVAIVGKTPVNCIFSGFTIRFRMFDSSKVNPMFLLYLFKSSLYRELFTRIATGTTISNLSQQVLSDIKVRLPEKETQDLIVKQLDDLDTKSELNESINQTLGQMAQAIFKSWFVDFDPVFDNALASGMAVKDFPKALQKKADQRQQVRQQIVNGELDAKPLPENIQQLFPSKFEQTDESSIGIDGWIPSGWHIEAVSKAIQVNPKTTLPKQTVAKFADMKAIPTSGYMVDEIIEKEYKGGAKFIAKDILFARITPCLQNGKTALVDFLSDNDVGFGSTEFIVLRQKDKVSYPFVACLAREDGFRAHCMQSMVGSSGRQRVQNACFDDYYLALPDKQELLERFTEMTSANFSKMTANKLESQSLTKLRETLLPKLISGEIDISNNHKEI